jgi:cobalt/nickel transport system permease protein
VGRQEVASLAPFAVGPVAILLIAHVPVRFALRRVVLLSPLILALAAAQPLLLRQPVEVHFGPWHYSLAAGWLAAGSLALRFALGLIALTALMSTTPFSSLLAALRSFHLPRTLVMMLGFVYRYLFVLLDEGMRLRRSRDFRGARLAPARQRLAAVGSVIGALFVRTLDRSNRVHLAMASRGFDGTPRPLNHPHLHVTDVAFLIGAGVYSAASWLYAFQMAGHTA